MNRLVSIITRTKDRSIFIPRVFETVVAQSYRPIEWIIVNDHGECIDILLEELKLQYTERLDEIEIVLINQADSTRKGAAAAANTGLEHAHGFYIKLLDDDDTLDSTCIEKQVHYMKNEKLPNERGVICHTQSIFEKIEDNQIHFISSSPLALTPKNITIADLAMQNQFTIHSFLYEKEILEHIGTYDEVLLTQEDWEFHLRFIIKYDIGVIHELLANYHIRTQGSYNNTITSQISEHLRYEATIRNHFIRNKEKYGEIATAILNATQTKQLQQKIDIIESSINKQSLLEVQLFLDNGNGYREENSKKLPVALSHELQTFTFVLTDYTNLTNLRFDPLNDSCVIEIEELKVLRADNTELNLLRRISANDCIHHSKSYFFDFHDPQMTFEGLNADELVDTIQLTATIRYLYIAKDAIKVCISQIKTELEEAKVVLHKKDRIIASQDHTIYDLKSNLDAVLHSKSWQMTAPLRIFIKLLKK